MDYQKLIEKNYCCSMAEPNYDLYRPSFIKTRTLFKMDDSVEGPVRMGNVLHLSPSLYGKMLDKHECGWLNQFNKMLQAIGKIKFIENGVEYEGNYSFWSKNWHVHMTKPIDCHIGCHIMYMSPSTYWKDIRVYESMKNEMIRNANEVQVPMDD